MNGVVKDFMSKNKIIVSYVRDVYGFKKGVVVALGKDKLGFSMVKQSEDIEWKRLKPWQIPSIQRMSTMGVSLEEIMFSPAFEKLEKDDHSVKVPLFNKQVGLMLAIDSALRSEIQFDGEEIKTSKVPTGIDGVTKTIWDNRFPQDKDLLRVIYFVRHRALKARWGNSEEKGE